jgi:hypothetical protein
VEFVSNLANGCDCSLLPAVTEIDDTTLAHYRTWQKVICARSVSGANRLPFFIDKFRSDNRIQQGPRRKSRQSW